MNKPQFTEIYRQHRQQILLYFLKRLGQKENSEDLTEEVFERVYKNLGDFQWQGIPIIAWIYKIAGNVLIDYYRKSKNQSQTVTVEDKILLNLPQENEKDMIAEVLADDEQKELYLALGQLEDTDQYIIYYKYFEELSLEEIATRLKMSPGNVGIRIHRLKKKLLSILEQKQI